MGICLFPSILLAKDVKKMVNIGCKVSHVTNLSPQQLVAYLKTHDQNCIRFLWDTGSQLQKIYTKENMLAVMDEISQQSKGFDGTNKYNLLELLRFVRVGFFHSYYRRPVSFTPLELKSPMVKILKNMEKNKVILDVLQAAKITGEWIRLIDVIPEISHHFYSSYESILKIFGNNPDLVNDYSQSGLLYSTMLSLQRVMRSKEFDKRLTPTLVNSLVSLGMHKNIVKKNGHIVNNAIWTLKFVMDTKNNKVKNLVKLKIVKIFKHHEVFSEPYLWAVKVLTQKNDCYFFTKTEKVCSSLVKAKLIKKLFPYQYSFDNGGIVFKTPLKSKKISKLYKGILQVKEGFKLITKISKPVKGDTNKILKVIIYGSKQDYVKYHTFLFGLHTNNGGIYIEEQGTFYTYERTAKESIYTLEELTKHESVHYYTARYLIEGFFNKTEMYRNNRLTWFDEGLAELLAGSSLRGIHFRPILARKIRRDGKDKWMSIKNIVQSSYKKGFTFYRYSAALLGFLMGRKPVLYKKLISSIRESKVKEYDQVMNFVKNNPKLNKLFFDFLQEISAKRPKEWKIAGHHLPGVKFN